MQRVQDDRLDTADIDRAVRRAYRKARKAGAAAEAKPDDANFHEWRKQVKYLFNQIEMLHSEYRKWIDGQVAPVW